MSPTLAAALAIVRTWARVLLGAPRAGAARPTALVCDDWSVVVTNAYGASRVAASLPDGWSVKGVLHDGRDVTDLPLEMRSGEELK